MIAYEQICKASMSVALAVGVTTGFGVRFIHELGTKEQKDKYLPLIAEGKFKTCMALTEPGGGTDILGALVAPLPKTRVTGGSSTARKFSSPVRTWPTLFTICKTEKDAKKSQSWTTIMVPRQSPGISIRKIGKISCHHCESVEIFYDDVEVPKENMLGTPR